VDPLRPRSHSQARAGTSRRDHSRPIVARASRARPFTRKRRGAAPLRRTKSTSRVRSPGAGREAAVGLGPLRSDLGGSASPLRRRYGRIGTIPMARKQSVGFAHTVGSPPLKGSFTASRPLLRVGRSTRSKRPTLTTSPSPRRTRSRAGFASVVLSRRSTLSGPRLAARERGCCAGRAVRVARCGRAG
jgi:hypothetical protein